MCIRDSHDPCRYLLDPYQTSKVAKSHKDQEDTGKDRGDHKTVKPVFCNDSGNNGCKAVGPAICTLLPPKAEITKPATIAVKIPACGPTPEASAKACLLYTSRCV